MAGFGHRQMLNKTNEKADRSDSRGADRAGVRFRVRGGQTRALLFPCR